MVVQITGVMPANKTHKKAMFMFQSLFEFNPLPPWVKKTCTCWIATLENSTAVNFSLSGLGNRLFGLGLKMPGVGTYNAES
jgi:hypothetical protein